IDKIGSCVITEAPNISKNFPCTAAVHAFCRDRGYGAGFGPVGLAANGEILLSCLDPSQVSLMTVTYADLAAHSSKCDDYVRLSSNPFYCRLGAWRYCEVAGFNAGGYGPVADPDG